MRTCKFAGKVIGLLQQKGGVGKTTLAINLAGHATLAGERVLLVDADPQGSAMAWSSARMAKPLFPVIGLAKRDLHRDVPALAADFDLVIIDGAPRVNELARSAILASDLVLIPIQPSPFDVWAAAETVALITEAQQYRPEIDAAFVINRRVANTVIGRDVAKAFAEQLFPVLDQSITQRVVFAEAAAQGLTVPELAPDGDAAREIANLFDACCNKNQWRTAA